MFRITTEKKQDTTVVTLDGRLTDEDVDEMRHVFSSVTLPASLLLGGLEDCSARAVAELKHWLAAGFTMQQATPFIRMTLALQTQQTKTLPKK